MAAPSPMTKPSAPASNGRVPVADSAPILQNLTKTPAPMLLSTPPVTTASYWPSARPSAAALSAASPDAQAASVVKLGPRKLNRFAIRPAMMFANSPGMVSSVMSGDRARNDRVVSAMTASLVLAGSDEKAADRESSRVNSGSRIRVVVA